MVCGVGVDSVSCVDLAAGPWHCHLCGHLSFVAWDGCLRATWSFVVVAAVVVS